MSTSVVPQTSIWQYYRFSTYGALMIYALAAVYCFMTSNWAGLYIVPLLAILEVSLSFDNALVNAVYLKRLNHVWQRRFLTWGIFVAVIGMRFVFPIVIVTMTATMNPIDVIIMAFTNPHAYASELLSAHVQLIVFGGIYLLQLGQAFLIDPDEKEARWLAPLEVPLEWIGKKLGHTSIVVFVTAVIATVLLSFKYSDERESVFIYGAASIALFQLVSWIGSRFDEEDENGSAGKAIRNLSGKAAASLFAYLELQDAMFSFDGVMGAFAFTVLIALIMAGLGIGALYVRSMTIHLVELGVLSEYRYLGNGAFTAIVFLPFAMWFDFPEYVTGGVSFLLIAAAFLHSRHANNKDNVTMITATGQVM